MDPTQLQMSPPQGYFLARPPGPQAGQYYPVAVPPGMFVAGMSPPPHPAFMHPYAMKSPPQQGYLQQQAMPMGYQQPIRGPQGQGYPLSPNQAQPSQRSQQHPDASAHSQQHHQQHQHHSNSNNEQQRRSASSTPTAGMSGQSADRPASTTQQPAPRDRVESTISDVSSSTAVDRRASTSNGRTGVKVCVCVCEGRSCVGCLGCSLGGASVPWSRANSTFQRLSSSSPFLRFLFTRTTKSPPPTPSPHSATNFLRSNKT